MATVKKIADTPEARKVAEIMKRARSAQAILEGYNQDQVDELITAMVWAVAKPGVAEKIAQHTLCLLYTSPSPRDATLSRMPSSA